MSRSAMRQAQHRLQVRTRGQGLTEITAEVEGWLSGLGPDDGRLSGLGPDDGRPSGLGPDCGLLTVFCRHTSASLVIQENADPDVQSDLDAFFRRLVQEDPSLYDHTLEGPDDMPAHIRSALTNSDLSIPVSGGRMALGTWQGIYLFEHRARPHVREIVLHYVGT